MVIDKVIKENQSCNQKNGKVPKYPSEITAEWLNDMLFPEASNNKIASIELDKDFEPWSLLGKAVRIKIYYLVLGCKPKSVIVKFQVNTSEPKREGGMYQILSEAKVRYVPHLYGVFGNGNLVLEDMTPTHSVLKDDFAISHIQSVIAILADVNSRFLGDPHILKDDLSHFINSININMGQSWDIFKKRYQDKLGEEIGVFEWMRKNPEIVSRHYNSGLTTLNHGDVNNSNLLFPKNGRDAPMLIDWQIAGQKVLPFDLSYFLVKNLTVKQRQKFEDVILKEYYDLLPEHMRKKYSFDRLILDYRACVTRSMLSAVTRVGPKFDSSPNRFKATDILVTRVIEAVRDLKPVEAIQELKGRGLFT